MKNKKILIIIILIIGLLLIGAGFGVSLLFGNKDKKEEKVRLEDDFYEYVNGDAISKAKIPDDSPDWGTVYEAQERVKEKKEALIDEILADREYKNDNLTNAVEVFTDYEGRNKRGLSELKVYFDMIDNAKNTEELSNAFITTAYDLGINPILNISIEEDIYDSSKKVVMFQPIVIEGNFELYTESKYETFVNVFLDYRTKVLKQYGYSEEKINDVNTKFDDLVKTVQNDSININDINNTLDYFKNKVTYDDLKNNYKNLPIAKTLEKFKLNNLEYYYVLDLGHLKAVDEYYTNEHLDTFKELAKYRILASIATSFTTDEYFDLAVEFSNSLSGTNSTSDYMKEEAIKSIKEAAIGDDLYIKYEEKYFTQEDKDKVLEMINEIKEYYKNSITNCTWMTDATKAEALKKLDTLKAHIGFEKGEEEDVYIYKSKAEGGTLLSNVIGEMRYNNSQLYKEVSKVGTGKYDFDDLEVNAFYNPMDNSINFPAAFKEFYANTNDEFAMLGTAGTVIAHEISHAFDNNGSQFDENGKVRNWWTDEDKEEYTKLTKKIVDYYSKYEFGGFKVDGEKTLGENIADIGAVNCVVAIAEKKNATNDNYKKLFESYAEIWASKATKEYIEQLHLSDTHSPDKVRVNAVLSSIDKFYEIYGIKENDGMYVKKEDRVSFW